MSKPSVDMQHIQERAHGSDWDYRLGSPHLTHSSLIHRLTDLLFQTLYLVEAAGLPLTVLEIGAGHGGYTEPMLAAGWEVTATEMSRASLTRMCERYGRNDRFEGLFDSNGSLDVVGDRRFSLVVASAVLHHIPDYLSFVSGPVVSASKVGWGILFLSGPVMVSVNEPHRAPPESGGIPGLAHSARQICSGIQSCIETIDRKIRRVVSVRYG